LVEVAAAEAVLIHLLLADRVGFRSPTPFSFSLSLSPPSRKSAVIRAVDAKLGALAQFEMLGTRTALPDPPEDDEE
jgi:hypothetical protein